MNDKTLEFRYYDMPSPEPIIIFHGPHWRRNYGVDAPNLHFHNILEIGVCREGSGRMLYEDCEKEYHAGSVSIVPKNIPHNTMNEIGNYSLWDYIFIDEAHYINNSNYDKNFIQKTLERIDSRHTLFNHLEFPEFIPLVDCIIREHEANKPYQKETIAALTMGLLMVIARINRDYDTTLSPEQKYANRTLTNCLQFVDEHYHEPLGVAELSSSVHISERFLRKIFHNHLNMAPLDYINLVRIRKSCEMLQRTDDPIDVISFKCGFSTPSTFNRNFRRYLGETPSKWRKSHVGQNSLGIGMRIQTLQGWY